MVKSVPRAGPACRHPHACADHHPTDSMHLHRVSTLLQAPAFKGSPLTRHTNMAFFKQGLPLRPSQDLAEQNSSLSIQSANVPWQLC